MFFGCGYFCIQLKQMVAKIYASDLGEDNDVLTSANPGMNQWVKGLRDTGGRCAPKIQPTGNVGFAAPKKGSKAAARLEVNKAAAGKKAKANDAEVKPLRPKKGSRGAEQEMAPVRGGSGGSSGRKKKACNAV